MTLGDAATWAYRKIDRPDLNGVAIEAALDSYLLICAAVPFDELQSTTPEISTVANQAVYDISAYDIVGIASIRMSYGNNLVRRLKRSHVRVYDAMQTTIRSKPATYARWAKNLEFMPVPDSSSYTFRVRYWMRPTIPPPEELDTCEVVFAPEWQTLLKWETLGWLYAHTEQFDKLQALMGMPSGMPRQPSHMRPRTDEYAIIPRLWNNLLRTISQHENVDEDFSINPINRRYTSG